VCNHYICYIDKKLSSDSIFLKDFEADDRLFEWQLLQEELLEDKLNRLFSSAKREMLDNFEKIFVPEYKNKGIDFSNLTRMLNKIKFYPHIRYNTLDDIRYKTYRFPVQLKEWFEKQPGNIPKDIFDIVSKIQPDPFAEAITDGSFKAYEVGGQSVFATFGINIDFNILDENVENFMSNHSFQLAESITQQISSSIKFEMLEGIRNAESIPELRNRITGVWNNPIDVSVPPKLDDAGNVIREGYSYQMKPDTWATTVARTEVSRAFAEGRLTGYKQTGVVQQVEFLITPDERLCPECEQLSGERYSLDDAEGVIPVHPNCRCTWIPIVDDMESASQQAQSNIEDLYEEEITDESIKEITGVEHVDLRGVGSEAKKDIHSAFQKITSIYGARAAARAGMRVIGNFEAYVARTESLSKPLGINARRYVNKSTKNTIAFAANPTTERFAAARGIYFNDKKYWHSKEKLMNTLSVSHDINWMPQVSQSFLDFSAFTVFHEFGHIVQSRILGSLGAPVTLRLRQRLKTMFKNEKKAIEANLGKYSLSNEKEFFANLYAKYMLEPVSLDDLFLPLAKEIDELFKMSISI
jgi:SPP1 gp7 family putative phage head morphogenesis protein